MSTFFAKLISKVRFSRMNHNCYYSNNISHYFPIFLFSIFDDVLLKHNVELRGKQVLQH